VRRATVALVLVLLANFVTPPTAATAQQPGSLAPQDVVLLIDNSGSMYRPHGDLPASDPENHRFTVAKYILDYLSVVASSQGRYRLGVVSFGADASLVVPLTSVENRMFIRDRLDDSGNIDPNATNHDLALDVAIRHMEASGSFSSGRMPTVIVITDGMLKDSRFGDGSMSNYKAKISEIVDRMKSLPCKLYVVLIGDAATEAESSFWQQQASLTGGKAFPIKSPPMGASPEEKQKFLRDLMEVYHDLVLSITGSTKVPAETAVVSEQLPDIRFDLDKDNYPYISQLVITMLQTADAQVIDFQVEANGRVVHPVPYESPESGWTVGVWKFPAPPYGEWAIRFQPGRQPSGVVMWVDRLFFEPHLNMPDPGQPLLPGQPLNIEATVVSDGTTPVDIDPEYPIRMSVEVERPSGASVVAEMERLDPTSRAAGYRYSFGDTKQPGKYIVRLTSYWTRKGGSAPQDKRTSEWVFLVADLPRSGGLQQTEYEAGEEARLELRVLGTGNQAQLSVGARLLDPQGRIIETVALMDDGKAPDRKAGDGIFTTLLKASQIGTAGQYTLQVEYTGESKDSPPVLYGPGREREVGDEVMFTVVVTLPSVWEENIYPTPGEQFSAGDDIPVRVQLKQYEKCTALTLEASLIGADGAPINTVELKDDGKSGDKEAGDGLFGGVLKGGAKIPGNYTLRLHLVGVHKSGQSFGAKGERDKTIAPIIIGVAVEPRFVSVNLDQPKVSRGAETTVEAVITNYEKAADIRVTGVVSTPYGEMEFPLAPVGDGKYVGVVPPTITSGRLGPGMWGIRSLRVRCSGTSKTGVPFTKQSEPIQFSIVPSALDKVLIGIGSALLLWALLWLLFIRDKKPRYLVGTLEVEYPLDARGERYALDDYLSRELTVGIGAGGVYLAPREGGAKVGSYIRLVGRLKKRRFAMEPVAFKASRDKDIKPLVSGTEPPYVAPLLLNMPIIGRLLRRRGVALFDQADLQVGDYRLNYSYMAPEDL